MKKQIVPFCKWVTTMLAQYMQWNDDARAQKPASEAKPGQRQQRGKSPHPSTPSSSTTTSSKPSSDQSTAGERKRPALPCLKCASPEHSVRHCPHAQPGEAEKLIAEVRERKQAKQRLHTKKLHAPPDGGVPSGSSSEGTPTAPGHVIAVADGLEVTATLLDSGSDDTLISRAAVEALLKLDPGLDLRDAPTPAYGKPVGGQLVVLSRVALIRKVSLATSAGPLVLRNLRCWVDETDEELNITIGRPMMERLGYSVDAFLVAALTKQPEYDGGGGAPLSPDSSPMLKMQRLQYQACYDPPSSSEATALEDFALTPKFESDDVASQRVQELFVKGLKEAVARGLSERGLLRMKASLDKYTDNFRVQFGLDPPVKVAPLKVRLKPGATPVKCKARRYPLLHRIFLDAHVKELLDALLIRENNRSRWCSPPRIVPKKDMGDLRMTIDDRAVNACTEAMPFPMPQLEVVITHVEGATVFFSCDWFKGYWQLPLDPESQELYTLMTHRGMYTPLRDPMGATDSVAFCQQAVEEIFRDEINRGVLAWLDDLLGYAATEAELCDLFDRVMQKCADYGLKLHPGKCVFFTKSIKWCGRVISAAGVTHCPDRIQGLVDMAPPITAADLQQLLCAANWMRTSIPEYANITGPLYKTLEVAMKITGSRKKSKLQKTKLDECQWGQEETASLNNLKDALARITPLAHPRADWDVCLFTDASAEYWGAVATQIPPGDLEKPRGEQRHEPLAFLSGKFVGAASRWAIVEKEAFAIVEACQHLDYLLLRPGGFTIFTDHRNLIYIFNPYAVDAGIHRYQADKLQRWALGLSCFNYEIEHVSGEENVWGDLLSRWGAPRDDPPPSTLQLRQLAVVDQVAPLQQPDFEWPTPTEIRHVQDEAIALRVPDDVTLDSERDLYVTNTGKVWLPPDAGDLHQRVCVIGHAGASGHRGIKATLHMIKEVFYWPTMSTDVEAFIRGCIHCLSTGNSREPRPFGPTLRATQPNEVLHFDFLSLPASSTGLHYVLVLKDGMSGYTELVGCPAATADEALSALVDWFKRFGIVYQWVSDQGTHFKNQLIGSLRRLFGAQHHFVTAYCPWANGSVEVVNRLVLTPPSLRLDISSM
ncbi:hypothetical protein PR001_g18944 [Phytophthora rubi]|uniref:Reverse transcriptase n=1 Tax=Phytophthora rubi TaxID=129364 RepID=A0A6A3JYA3_9STRA|nr:hypothetical protein PR001_g18944 [Phytophthora rubi]